MSGPLRFRHRFVDASGSCQRWGAAAVGDLLGNGRLGMVTGPLSGRFVRYYEYDPAADTWRWFDLTDQAAPNAGTVVIDLDGDGAPEIVIRAKDKLLAWFKPGPAGPWPAHTIATDLVGDGTALADLDGNGHLDVVVGTGWFQNVSGDGRHWRYRGFLDADLGTHQAQAADFTGNGYPDIVGKTWLPNAANGNAGRGHVDFLENLGT